MPERPSRLVPGCSRALAAALVLIVGGSSNTVSADSWRPITFRLRSRVEDPAAGGRFRVVEKAATWETSETAIIVCDMWDLHHCLNAVRRVEEMAPTMDRVLRAARGRGVLIIHAPSGCMETYKDHPARKMMLKLPRSKDLPEGIGQWCRQIPSEEKGTYPIDQSNGGEDDDPAEHRAWAAKLAARGRDPKAPWKSQVDRLAIEDGDLISDSGEEIWSVLQRGERKNVILMGVHLNMCVLGRPFGLRQMAKNGKNVVLMRDMTDTMYDPHSAPYVSHFTGTDLMVEHVEKFVCPTITSDQFLGGMPFHFKEDGRPHVAFVLSEDEYKTEETVPVFASAELVRDYRLSYIFSNPSDPNDLPGMNILADADVAFLSARRRLLPRVQLDLLHRHVADSKPVVAIRTASHAFAPRGNGAIPAGHDAWPEFDADVLGGHYTGHHGPGASVAVTVAAGAGSDPILKGVDPAKLVGHGSLYKVSPLAPTARPILVGSVAGAPPEPVAWTNAPATKGRVFYTSLGHADDFAEPAFARLLRNAIDWAAGRVPSETAR